MNTKPSNGSEGRISAEDFCPECGSGAVSTRIERQTFPYGEGMEAVELEVSVPVKVCSECGFEYLDESAEGIKHEAVCNYLGVLTPKLIRKIREEYGLSRAEFSKLTRLGEATLNRWENGILIQNQAYDRYLRLLRFPENVRRMEAELSAGSHHSSGTVISFQSYRFRAVKDDRAAREGGANFQLRKRAVLA
jgi:putative zinc finger/helix-turn-helix YgiT family protein